MTNYVSFTYYVAIVFDKNDRNTFDQVDGLFKSIRTSCHRTRIILLVGNKCDLLSEVSFDEAQEKAMKLGVYYVETSVKTNYMTDFIFSIVLEIVKNQTSILP